MAQTATLYRFKIDVSDIDRGVYESIDLRIAMHPSEIPHYLITRVIAYALNVRRGLEFSPGGLSDTDAPCIRCISDNGTLEAWIEVGNPSAKKLHKGSKAAREVKVYTYKDPRSLLEEIASQKVHRSEEIPIFALDPKFLDQLAGWLERQNDWTLLHQEGSLTITSSHGNLEGILNRLQ
jgi:uncharacterized protein YaeQ